MPVIDTVAIGANLIAKMKAAGKTVKDIQIACGFTSGNAIYKWINDICMPTIDNMVIIADICFVTLNDIVVIQKQKGKNFQRTQVLTYKGRISDSILRYYIDTRLIDTR